MNTTEAIMNAIKYLEKVYVGRGEEERLISTISALKREIERRKKP